LKDFAEITGIAAIVVSLIFVGLELRQSQRIAYIATVVDRGNQRLDLHNLTIENMDVWHRGNAGEELNPEEIRIYRQIFEGYLGLEWQRWFSANQLDYFSDFPIADFAGFLMENPGARREYERYLAEGGKRRRMIMPSYADPFGTAVLELLEEHQDEDE